MKPLIIFCAVYLLFLSTLIALVALVRSQKRVRRDLLMQAIISGLLSFGFVLLASKLFNNPRPFVVDGTIPLIRHGADNGFPSNHATISFLLAGLFWWTNRRVSIVLICLALLVSLGRVGVHVHHVIDIIGGAFIALVATVIAHSIVSSRRKDVDQDES